MSLLTIWLVTIAVHLLAVIINGHSAIETAADAIYFSAVTLLIVHFFGKKP